MAMWKHVKQEGQANGKSSSLSVKYIEAAQNSISKALHRWRKGGARVLSTFKVEIL